MLTVAYCRVSTEEQAAEGFSIEGQGVKLRAYAALHDLGEVVEIADGGWSGKNMDRPGLARLLAMVDRGHVSHVLVWRLDRLSRNLGDLQTLASGFLDRGVQLHSVTENLDLSSATGRMFYNILGSFAQFYREQLAENVRLGMSQAVRQGRWINRPKTGYDLGEDGVLVPNDEASRVRSIFRLRADGLSLREIEDRTGIKYSTVSAILNSRIYLGEVLLSGQWFPGLHEPLVTAQDFEAAHRGHVPRRRRSRQVLAGRVRCGLCGRLAAVEYCKKGRPLFRCRHRGVGCAMPRRAATGLERAAVLGLSLIGRDQALREAIRRELDEARGPVAERRAARLVGTDGRVVQRVEAKRRKLLDLYYSDRISADLFAQEDRRLLDELELAQVESDHLEAEMRRLDGVGQRFDDVAAVLLELDVEQIWAAATEAERRVLVEELVAEIAMFPDHIEVEVAGAPRLNVLLEEVGLLPAPAARSGVQTVGVRGGT
jgi:site-specific DNA recombinase